MFPADSASQPHHLFCRRNTGANDRRIPADRADSPGDLVLSQDVATGALEFRPVVVVHHNPPNHTLRITLSDDEILFASVYHRFWRSGKGWAQARELKPGDTLRSLGSTVRVVSVEPGSVEPLYNLDVAQNRSFFVGNGNVLVHDNTLPPARHALFNAQPNLRGGPAGPGGGKAGRFRVRTQGILPRTRPSASKMRGIRNRCPLALRSRRTRAVPIVELKHG